MINLKISVEGYVCGTCGIEGVKLWRDYQSFLDYSILRCVTCACENQEYAVNDVDDDGCILRYGMRSDQIGWLVPAIPTWTGGMWGYSSVPEDAVNWWTSLPTRKT